MEEIVGNKFSPDDIGVNRGIAFGTAGDPNKALSEIITQVNSVKNQMPADAQASVISIAVGQTIDAMMISFNSKVLPANKITDYLIRVVQPQLQAVEGVQLAEILGAKRFAVRVWLKPDKLAAYGLTATDVSTASASRRSNTRSWTIST